MRAASLLLLLFMSAAAYAADGTSSVKPSETYTNELVRLHEAELLSLAGSPALHAFLEKNKSRPTSLKEIIDLDTRWMLDSELRNSITGNAVAKQFQRILDDERYGIVELMLTDGFGALLAGRPTPSDYWQGDEEKFYAPIKSAGIYATKAAWDESSHTNSLFISVPIESNGDFIGVLIAGIKITPEYMMQMPIEELNRLRAQ